MNPIYLDSAATTKIREEVVLKMSEVLESNYGNASSTHGFGRSSKSIIENCRKRIASHINASPSEIIFTSGGTEADNLVLRSAVKDLNINHIITSKIEHHAVLHTVEQLEKDYSIKVSYVNILDNGFIDYTHLEKLLKSSYSTLVSLMHINNEIGNILDIQKVAILCKDNNALFHSDTVQSVGHYNLDFSKIPIDFAAVAAHKFHGPKGIGFAFVRKNSGLKASIRGGEQERGLRAGTEAVYAVAGLNEALKLSYQHLTEETNYVKSIKNYFKDTLLKEIPDAKLNGCCGDDDLSTYTLLNVLLPIPPEKA